MSSSNPAPAVKAPALLKEKPILAYPRLAHALGVNEAIILQQIYFYMKINERKKKPIHYYDGRWWVYNSYKQWRDEHFPWLTPRGVQHIILKLETKGLLISCQGLDNPQDRRKWYTVDLEALNKLLSTSKFDRAKIARSTNTQCTSNMHEVADDSTETTTETLQRNRRESARSIPVTEDLTPAPDGDSVSDDVIPEKTLTPETVLAVEANNKNVSQPINAQAERKRLPQPPAPPEPSPMRQVIPYGFNNGAGGLIGRLSAFFAGRLKDHPRQRAWFQTQPTERPATPQEVVALALWYSRNPEYSRSFAERRSLPKTPAVLRERLDEFRGSVGYTRAMELAAPIVDRLLKGETVRLEPVTEIKTMPIAPRMESAQAYKPLTPTLDPAYVDRRQAGDLELAAKLFGA